MNGVLKFLRSLAIVAAAMAAILTVIYKITKRHLKINVEVLPDDIEDENELTAAVDVVDMDIIDQMDKRNEKSESDIEISFTEAPEEE